MTRRRPLQRRIVRYIVFAVVVSLGASAGVLVISKQRSLIRSMEDSATMFSAMMSLPLAEDVAVYRDTGHHLLQQQVARLARLNRDLVRIRVVDVRGKLAMDAIIGEDDITVRVYPSGEAPRMTDGSIPIEAVEGVEVVAGPIRTSAGRRLFRVVAPAVEEWGRHTYSLVADFSYARINTELIRTALVTFFFIGVGLVIAYAVSVLLARTITQNIEKLHEGVQRMAANRLGERVSLDSEDEIQDLADSFNAMADRLHASIAALQEAYTRLESLDQAKRNLLANVSHELKTPLTAIRGYVELLAEGKLAELTPQGVRAMEVCQKNVLRLSMRVEELVELARLDREDMLVVMRPLEIASMLEGIVETVWPRLEEKDQACSVSLQPGLPEVEGSQEHLERVFLNLVDNAIKFTPSGGFITISAEVAGRGGRTGVQVCVADTGVGIPEDELPSIFDRFFQVDQSSRRRFGGMGLGLALAHRAVELHHGEIWVQSRVGEGSSFFVWLPVKEQEESRSSGAGPEVLSSDRLDPEFRGGAEA